MLEEEKLTDQKNDNELSNRTAENSGGDFFARFFEKSLLFIKNTWQKLKSASSKAYIYIKESLKKLGIYIKEGYLKFKPKALAFCKCAAAKTKVLAVKTGGVIKSASIKTYAYIKESLKKLGIYIKEGYLKFKPKALAFCKGAAAKTKVFAVKTGGVIKSGSVKTYAYIKESLKKLGIYIKEGYLKFKPKALAFCKGAALKIKGCFKKKEAEVLLLSSEENESASVNKPSEPSSAVAAEGISENTEGALFETAEQTGPFKSVLSGIKEFFADLGNYFHEMGEAFKKDEYSQITDTARKKRLRFQALVMALLMFSSAVLPSFASFDYAALFAKRDTAFYCERADKYIQKGNTEKAASCIEKAEALAADDEERVKITLVKASYAFATGDGEQGLKLLEEYLLLSPDDDASRAYIAQYYVENNMYNEALIHYSVLIRRGYDTEEIYYLAGVCAMNAEKYLTAEENFTYAAALGGETKNIYYYRGVCRMYLEKYASAADDFTIEMSFGSTDKQTLCYYRGLCYLADSEYTLARDDLKYAADEKNGATDTAAKARELLNEYFTGGRN